MDWVLLHQKNGIPLHPSGEVSEWLKEHAWKVCIRQKCIEGSNPFPSATQCPFTGHFVFRRLRSVGHQANKNQNEPSDAGAGHWVDNPPPRDHEHSE